MSVEGNRENVVEEEVIYGVVLVESLPSVAVSHGGGRHDGGREDLSELHLDEAESWSLVDRRVRCER